MKAIELGEVNARNEIIDSINNRDIYGNKHTINYLVKSLKIKLQIITSTGINNIQDDSIINNNFPIVNVFYRPDANEHYNAFYKRY